MKSMFSFALAATFASAVLAALAPAPTTAQQHVQIIEHLLPNVHVLRQPEVIFVGVVGNVTIIEQTDGIVLVDTGPSHGAGQRVVDAVKSISMRPVKAVVITHWHNDHPLGLSAIVAEWPDTDIISTRTTLEDMDAGRLGNIPRERSAEYEEVRAGLIRDVVELAQKNAADESLSEEERREWRKAAASAAHRIADVAGTRLVLPRTTFTDRMTIPDPIAPVEVMFLGRANTSGDAVVWLPNQRVLVAGDAVVEPIPYMFNMYPSEMIGVLERIKSFDYAWLVPGHGEVLRDEAYLDQLIAFIREVQDQVTPLARQGLELVAVRERIDLSEQKRLFADTSPWLGSFFDQYALDPLVDSVYREARGERLGPPPINR